MEFDEAFVRSVVKDLLPKVRESAVFMTIVPDRDDPDIEFLIQLGAAVWYNKPIMAVGLGERRVPVGLRRVSEEIVEDVDLLGGASQARVEQALKAMFARHPIEET